jgi:hypothetical protein
MSPIAIVMNLVLGTLLVLALGVGLRLERRLKALREGQANFALAVGDLDRAAQRAERGLAELRLATDEAVDLLAGRIEKARELASRLETFTANAARPMARAPARAPAREPAGPAQAEAAADDLVLRLTGRQALTGKGPARTEPRPTPGSRANVDEDLFDSGPRLVAGGRR